MKRCSVLLFCLFSYIASIAQTNDAPYQKHPTFPPIKILMPDSSTWFTKEDLPKKKEVMVMVFNPLCNHCQEVSEDLVKNADLFKDIHIVMVTSFYFDSLRNFIHKYDLDKHTNITVGYDKTFFLNTFYQLVNLPFLAFYNKRKELISVHQGSLPIGTIIKEFEKK